MGDRRPSFSFRFWSSATPASRQKPASQTTTSPLTTSDSTPTPTPRAESRSINRSTTNTTDPPSTASPKAENKTRGRQSTSSITNSTSVTTLTTESKTPDSQLTSNTTNDSFTTPPKVENLAPGGRMTPPKGGNKTLDSESISNTTTAFTTLRIIENKMLNNQSNSNTTNPTSTNPPTSEKKILDDQSDNAANSPPNPITRSGKEKQIIDKQKTTITAQMTPTSTEVQKSKPTATAITSPTKEPKVSTQSLSSSQPVTTSRPTTQSRSLPQPSSPSSTIPQTQSVSSFPSRMGSQTLSRPQRGPQPRSPIRVGSRAPKHASSTNPSKESRRTTQEISRSYEAPTSLSNEKDQRPIASQQEPLQNSGAASDYDNQTVDRTSSKHNEVDVMPSKSSKLGTTATQNADSSTTNVGHEPTIELNAKPEETKDVKEVMQATNTLTNQEAKKEVNNLLTSKYGSEAQITEKATSFSSVKPTNTASQPKKRSTMPNNHNKFALPIGEHVTLHKDVTDDISTFVNQIGIGDLKSIINDKPVSVITLAGENRGASLQMGSNSSKTEGPVHIRRSYKINPDESVEATTDGEGSSKGKSSEDAKDAKDQPAEAYVNNNAQGINNSLVLSSSVIERNPGVHMVVGHVPKEPIQSTHRASSLETGKSENNMTRMDRLKYEPTVRRRCLRGLFLETSDSDPENPKKPRRHGCRIGCQQRDKENDTDVLRS